MSLIENLPTVGIPSSFLRSSTTAFDAIDTKNKVKINKLHLTRARPFGLNTVVEEI